MAQPGSILFQECAGRLPRDVPIGEHDAGNCHDVRVCFHETNGVFEIGGMKLDIIIEESDVTYIARYPANGRVALRTSSDRSDDYGYSVRQVTRGDVFRRTDTQINMSGRPGLSPDG